MEYPKSEGLLLKVTLCKCAMPINYSVTVNRIGDWQVCGRNGGCALEWVGVKLWILVSVNCGLSPYCTHNETWLVGWLIEGGVGEHLARVSVSSRPPQCRLSVRLSLLDLSVWVISLRQLLLMIKLGFIKAWHTSILSLLFFLNDTFPFRCRLSRNGFLKVSSYLLRMVLCLTGNPLVWHGIFNSYGISLGIQNKYRGSSSIFIHLSHGSVSVRLCSMVLLTFYFSFVTWQVCLWLVALLVSHLLGATSFGG